MKYKIKGKEIELLPFDRVDFKKAGNGEIIIGGVYPCNTYSDTFEKINELIKVLGEPVEEKPNWDKNNMKVGGKYFCLKEVWGDLRAQSYYWRNDEVDKFRIATNNIFETYGEAEDYRRKILGE